MKQNKKTTANIFYDKKQTKSDKIMLQIYAGSQTLTGSLGVIISSINYSELANDLGVKYLTLYAFSTENWSRPEDEVKYLMKLPVDFLKTFLPELIEKNVKVTTIGFTEALPKHTKNAIEEAIEKTKHNTGLNLVFALNYGGRAEILNAVKELYHEVELRIDQIGN